MFGKIWVSGNCCAIYFANIKGKRISNVHYMLFSCCRWTVLATTCCWDSTGPLPTRCTPPLPGAPTVWPAYRWSEHDKSDRITVCTVQCAYYSVQCAVCRVGTYITVYCTRVNHTVHCTSAKTVWEAEYNGRRRGGVFWLDFILVVSVKNNRLVLCGELTSLLCEDFSRKVRPDYSYYCKRRADLKKRF